MLKGKEKVLQYFDTNDCPYWTVFAYSGSRNNSVLKGSDEPNLSKTIASEKLSKDLDLLEPGRYVIVCKATPEQTKSFREIAFELEGQQKSGSAISGVPAADDVDRRISEAIAAVRMEFHVRTLEEKIKELERQVSERNESSLEQAVSGIIKRLDPYTELIADRVLGKPAAPTQIGTAGFTNTTKQNNTNMAEAKSDQEATERLKKALSDWQDIDQERMLLIIEKIAHVAKTDQGKYNMFVPMLLNA